MSTLLLPGIQRRTVTQSSFMVANEGFISKKRIAKSNVMERELLARVYKKPDNQTPPEYVPAYLLISEQKPDLDAR